MTGGAIVVAGEALVDLVPSGDGTWRAHPGGGPFNAARTIARLGQPVSFLGRLSTDAYGRSLQDALARDGVRLDAVVGTSAPTTLAVAVPQDGTTTYAFYAAGTSAPGLTLADARAAIPAGADVLSVGTLGLVFEPIASTLEALVAAAPAGTLVAVDPNCRPTAITDSDGYRARLGRVLDRADLVKVSVEDLEWLAPGERPARAARALLRGGARVVLVTRGGDGALIVTEDRFVGVPAPRATVVDTIGAGDAFVGAYLAWWAHAGLDREALGGLDAVHAATVFACAVAAMTCERAGADPPRLGELRDGAPTVLRGETPGSPLRA